MTSSKKSCTPEVASVLQLHSIALDEMTTTSPLKYQYQGYNISHQGDLQYRAHRLSLHIILQMFQRMPRHVQAQAMNLLLGAVLWLIQKEANAAVVNYDNCPVTHHVTHHYTQEQC